MHFRSKCEDETESFGCRLGALLPAGTVVGLSGDLGAGKTAFVRGLARGLGIDPDAVHSPTFLTAVEHDGHRRLVHVDLYRHENGLADGGWLDELIESDAVTAIEWVGRLGADTPDDMVLVRIERTRGSEVRRIAMTATGGVSHGVLSELAGAMATVPHGDSRAAQRRRTAA